MALYRNFGLVITFPRNVSGSESLVTLEGGLKWDDPEIGVEWPMPEGMTKDDLTISDKDQKWNGIKDFTPKR